jgi:hypothetical protein
MASDVAGFKEAHARYLAAKTKGEARVQDLPTYFWRPSEVNAEIQACMLEHGLKNCMRRDYLGVGKHGLELWAVIVSRGGADSADGGGEILAAFDVSYLCPPRCDEVAPA